MNKLCLSDESEKLLINYKNLKYKLNFNYKDSEKTSKNLDTSIINPRVLKANPRDKL